MHVPFADPYCPALRSACPRRRPDVVDGGTMVVIEGPRFSTRAESQWYAAQGWSLVNMTGHPEAVLARELALCYAPIALVTDLDAGVDRARRLVTQAKVFAEFARNIDALRDAADRCRAELPGEQVGCDVRAGSRRHRPPVRAAMRVLVTGAAGFIGSAVAAALRESRP